MSALSLSLLTGCASDSPLIPVGEGAVKVLESAILGKKELTRDIALASSANMDRPMVRTRRVSEGNPGDLYSGLIRTPQGHRFTMMLTVIDGGYSHAAYPEAECASNLKPVRTYSTETVSFFEHVYFDTKGQCEASDRIHIKRERKGGYAVRMVTGGQLMGEGMLLPAVVPVPDSLVGDWEGRFGHEYGGPGTRIGVRLAQDGESYTLFKGYCNGRSRLSYQSSSSMSLSGYHEATECDNGGYVEYQQINRNTLQRTSYDPHGGKTSQLRLTRN